MRPAAQRAPVATSPTRVAVVCSKVPGNCSKAVCPCVLDTCQPICVPVSTSSWRTRLKHKRRNLIFDASYNTSRVDGWHSCSFGLRANDPAALRLLSFRSLCRCGLTCMRASCIQLPATALCRKHSGQLLCSEKSAGTSQDPTRVNMQPRALRRRTS